VAICQTNLDRHGVRDREDTINVSQAEAILRALERETESIVLEPDRHGYEDARKVFNDCIDRRPAAIVRVRDSRDIAKSVRILAEGGLSFTVRGGGHGIAGTCVRDGAVMLDLSLTRKVTYDDDLGIATSEAGALWCDYDAVTTRYGYASTGGIVSHTGVTGLTLGGGLGWLMGEAGLACDSLVGLTVIDSRAESQYLREGDPELRSFRGSGRSLGVVTELRFRPRPIGSTVTSGRITVPLSASAELLTRCSLAIEDSPDWLTVSPLLLWADGEWRAVLDFVSTRGKEETSKALKKTFDREPTHLQEVPYLVVQRQFDDELRFGRRNYWKSVAMSSIDMNLGRALADHLQRSPSRQTFISVDVMHGRALNEPPGGSSYKLRGRPLVVLFNTIWQDMKEDPENIQWCREGFALLSSSSRESSTYSNYFSQDDVGVQPGSAAVLSDEEVARWTPDGLM